MSRATDKIKEQLMPRAVARDPNVETEATDKEEAEV